MKPSISGVAIDTLLFSRIGSPLCHRYRIISRTGSHASFRGTYIRRLRAFLKESDSVVVRRLHCQLAQELATWISLPTDSPASVPSGSAVGYRIVFRFRRPCRYQFVRAAMVGVSSSGGGIFSTAIDGSVASSVCGAGRWPHQMHPLVLIWRQVVKKTRVVQWTRCLCRRLVSTWICCHHRRRMIQRIWRNVGSPVSNKPPSPKSIGGATAEVPSSV